MSVAMILAGSAAIASKEAAALPVDEGSAAAASNKENADVNTTTTDSWRPCCRYHQHCLQFVMYAVHSWCCVPYIVVSFVCISS